MTDMKSRNYVAKNDYNRSVVIPSKTDYNRRDKDDYYKDDEFLEMVTGKLSDMVIQNDEHD